MRVSSAAFLAAMVMTAVNAFQPLPSAASTNHNRMPTTNRPTSERWSSTAQTPCATPDVIPESVTAKALRSATLTNADGALITLGDQMGTGTSIVVFLRHLG
jgi:hypothetical protein